MWMIPTGVVGVIVGIVMRVALRWGEAGVGIDTVGTMGERGIVEKPLAIHRAPASPLHLSRSSKAKFVEGEAIGGARLRVGVE
jgi:hypothetical protein